MKNDLRKNTKTAAATGFILYRFFFAWNPVCGSTIPVMFITAAIQYGYQKKFS